MEYFDSKSGLKVLPHPNKYSMQMGTQSIPEEIGKVWETGMFSREREGFPSLGLFALTVQVGSCLKV